MSSEVLRFGRRMVAAWVEGYRAGKARAAERVRAALAAPFLTITLEAPPVAAPPPAPAAFHAAAREAHERAGAWRLISNLSDGRALLERFGRLYVVDAADGRCTRVTLPPSAAEGRSCSCGRFFNEAEWLQGNHSCTRARCSFKRPSGDVYRNETDGGA
jgi:hypothetical protein